MLKSTYKHHTHDYVNVSFRLLKFRYISRYEKLVDVEYTQNCNKEPVHTSK